eukprot:GHVN01024176.1.p1 GENE.GHVN01024176.1~~GHVN01024176.1.p1  ORF type:complete len:1004 (-),score=80.04 GHVN01024176.1:579-3590(-)
MAPELTEPGREHKGEPRNPSSAQRNARFGPEVFDMDYDPYLENHRRSTKYAGGFHSHPHQYHPTYSTFPIIYDDEGAARLVVRETLRKFGRSANPGVLAGYVDYDVDLTAEGGASSATPGRSMMRDTRGESMGPPKAAPSRRGDLGAGSRRRLRRRDRRESQSHVGGQQSERNPHGATTTGRAEIPYIGGSLTSDMIPGRPFNWPSTQTFIVAALGANLGSGATTVLGNIVFTSNPTGFFLVYATVMILVGMPLLQSEIVLGNIFQGGTLQIFDGLVRRSRGIGVASVYFSFLALLCDARFAVDVMTYVVHSFSGELPWEVPKVHKWLCPTLSIESLCTESQLCVWNNATLIHSCVPNQIYSATKFYNDTILNRDEWDEIGFDVTAFLGLILVWTSLLVFMVCWGKRFLPHATGGMLGVVSVGASIILVEALPALIGQTWDTDGITWTFLLHPQTWRYALSSCLTSLSVAYGTSSALASYLRVGPDVAASGSLITILSLIMGSVFYGAMFVLVGSTGTDSEVHTAVSDPFVLHVVVGELLSRTAGGQVSCLLYYIGLFLTTLNLILVRTTSVLTPLEDCRLLHKSDSRVIGSVLVAVAFICSLPLVLDWGPLLYRWLTTLNDATGVAALVFAKCYVLGWMVNTSRQKEVLGSWAVWTSTSGYAIACTFYVTYSVIDKTPTALEQVVCLVISIALYSISIIVGVALSFWNKANPQAHQLNANCWERIRVLLIGNLSEFAHEINSLTSTGWFFGTHLGGYWMVVVKFLVPAVTLCLVGLKFDIILTLLPGPDYSNGDDVELLNTPPSWVIIVCMTTIMIGTMSMILGVVWPQAYTHLRPPRSRYVEFSTWRELVTEPTSSCSTFVWRLFEEYFPPYLASNGNEVDGPDGELNGVTGVEVNGKGRGGRNRGVDSCETNRVSEAGACAGVPSTARPPSTVQMAEKVNEVGDRCPPNPTATDAGTTQPHSTLIEPTRTNARNDGSQHSHFHNKDNDCSTPPSTRTSTS